MMNGCEIDFGENLYRKRKLDLKQQKSISCFKFKEKERKSYIFFGI